MTTTTIMAWETVQTMPKAKLKVTVMVFKGGYKHGVIIRVTLSMAVMVGPLAANGDTPNRGADTVGLRGSQVRDRRSASQARLVKMTAACSVTRSSARPAALVFLNLNKRWPPQSSTMSQPSEDQPQPLPMNLLCTC